MTLGFALVLVLTGHVIADFYLQTNRVARGKGESGPCSLRIAGTMRCAWRFSFP